MKRREQIEKMGRRGQERAVGKKRIRQRRWNEEDKKEKIERRG